jgi:hypothetical protein
MTILHYILLFASAFIIAGLFGIWRWSKGSNSATGGSGASGAPAPATTNKGFGWGWLVITVFVSITTWWITNYSAKIEVSEIRQQQTLKTMGVRYEWYWELPSGVYVHGRNRSSPNDIITEGIPKGDPNVIWADLHYMEYGSPEIERIRIQKVGGKRWQGTSEQDNPMQRCRLDLLEVSPGMYAGKITWQDGKEGTCYLKRL